jgi:autotransporter-associated beta strand protein
VTNTLVGSSAQFQAIGGARTIGNTFDFNGGFNFSGTNSINFNGPATIINAAAASRTFSNQIATAGTAVTFGATPGSTTLTIGNPVANGGDGVGKTVIFASNTGATTVLNSVMQDPAAGGGTASGAVQYQGQSAGIIKVMAGNLYTGNTSLNGSSVVQFDHDSTGTSGPFGVGGTMVFNNTSNNVMQPIGGGTRTVSNPVSLVFGMNWVNATADTTSATLTGPIALTTTGRTITNNLSAGAVLTLGSAGSPSTFTLSSASTQTLTLTGSGTMVINDKIQPGTGALNGITIAGAGSVNLNNSGNTYDGGTLLSGAGTIIPITVSSNALPGGSFTSGPFGTGAITVNNGTNQHLRPTGGDRSISNQMIMTTGFAMDNATADTSSLTMAGPITMTGSSRFISNGFAGGSGGGSLILGDASQPNTITLPTTTGLTLSLAAIAGPIVVNDVIQNATGTVGNVAVNPQNGNSQPITFNGASTYTGNTTIGGGAVGGGMVNIGVSTVGGPGLITSGPFGTGTVIVNQTAAAPVLQPVGAGRTVANAVTLTSGVTASNAAGAFNLDLTGPISMPGTTTTRVITNNLQSGTTLTLGSQATPSTITAVGSVNFAGAANSSTVVNDAIVDGTSAASVTAQGVGLLKLAGNNTYSGPTNINGGTVSVGTSANLGAASNGVTFNGGTLQATGNVASGSRDVTINAGGATVDDGGNTVTFGTVTGAGNLTKGGSGTLAVTHVRAGNVSITGGTLALAANGGATGTSVVNATSITGGGRLDIADNHLVDHTTGVGTAPIAGTYSGMSGLIQSGRNGGNWSGSGIVTSQTDATMPDPGSFITTIGVATGQLVKGLANPADTVVWAGQTITGSDTLVMYTYGGDANLDGRINVDDYGQIDFHVGLGVNGWSNGDFNYDGKINVDDYGIIDFNVGIQGSQFFNATSAGPANLAGVSAVPEPASLGLVSLGALAFVGRRTRRPNSTKRPEKTDL